MVDEVEVEDLSFSFGERIALEDVSFRLESPFFCVVMGPNGAGKTTLLKLMLGLLKPMKGYIKIYGHDPIKEPRAVKEMLGYVPQIINVDFHVPVTVEEVVAMGALSKLPPPRIMSVNLRARVDRALRLVGIEDPTTLFMELSGGQRQRALIARALVRDSKLLLLDEPFSMLDFDMRCEIAKLLHDLHKNLGIDVFLVAHELSPCIEFEPTVILLNKRIYAIGRAEEVLRIENLRRAYPGLTEVPAGFILGEDHG